MKLIDNVKKRKIAYWFLAFVLAVGVAMSPFPVIEKAEALSVADAWVELSHATALNTTSTALEYIIQFTTTTALTGGVDTITINLMRKRLTKPGKGGS